VHIPLRRFQINVPRQLLNCSPRCSAHREMRTETVSKNVNATLRQLRSTSRVVHVITNGDQTSGTNTIAMVANAVAGFSRDLTGRWRGAVGADTIITLTQTASSLSGTFDSVSLKGTVSGSVSNTGQVTLTVTVPGFQPFTLTGQADAAGNTISGQVNGSGFQNEAFTLRRL
jgi:hypothetical protein